MSQKKHAYLIVAHNNFKILCLLLQSLDDVRNDIYLHIGSDVKIFNIKEIEGCCHSSHLRIFRNPPVIWGDKSQIDVTSFLLQQSTETYEYAYYHLISGVYFPLKSQDYIHSFFSQNNGKEFISFDSKMYDNPDYFNEMISGVKYYHLFTSLFKMRKGRLKKIFGLFHNGLDRFSLTIQKLFRVNRLKRCSLEIHKGANWFSITHDFAMFVLMNKDLINNLTKYSLCADEIFLQTLCMSSRFKNNLYFGGNMRYIDWDRGSPYTFRMDDKELLLNSPMLFARKFDESIDYGIVESLYVSNQNLGNRFYEKR